MRAERQKVLLVTPRDAVALAVQEMTEGDWDLVRVSDAASADAALADGSPDVVLADLDGTEVLGWLDGLRIDMKWLPVLGLSKITLAHDHLVGVLRLGDLSPASLHWALRCAVGRGEARRRAIRDVNGAGLLLAGEMTAAVAHEINNPLMGMLANLQFVEQAVAEERLVLPTPVGEALAEARQGTERIVEIVRDLRHLTRSKGGPPRAVRVTRVIDAALAMARARIIDRARITQQYEVDVPVRAHEGRLFQVLLNLLLNAAQSIEAGHQGDNEVLVAVGWTRDGVQVTVRDTGSGIRPEHLDRVFEPYFTTKEHGTGLGLALSRRYIEEMGGSMSVTSELGRGTSFVLLLAESSYERSSQTLIPDLGEIGGARILVVDDQPLVGRAVQRVLARNHEVKTVPSAAEALALFEDGASFDLVFCDVVMPGMTGLDLHRVVDSRWPSLARHFVFMTGGTVSDDVTEMLDRLPNPRVRKPLGSAELRDLVAELMLSGF